MERVIEYKKQSNGLDSWMIKYVENGEEVKCRDVVHDMDVLNWKLKATLVKRDLFTQVENALNSMPEPNKTMALLAWNGSPTVHINSNTTKLVQGVLGLTIQEVTEIFQDAVNLDI